MADTSLPQFVQDPFSLDELRILKKEDVEAFVQSVQALSDAEVGNRDLIFAIGTGGTISMKRTDKGWEPDLDFSGIFERTEPSLANRFLVMSFDAYRMDSSQLQIDHVHDLAIMMSYVDQQVARKHSGFLLLHGTDTMAQSASYMAMQMGPHLNFPIVYTGAQKSIHLPINDASLNIKHALYTLESLRENDLAEVLIVFGDAVLLATGARKLSDENRNAFDTIMHELAADLSRLKYPIEFPDWVRKRPAAAHQFKPKIYGGVSHVLDISSKMSMDPEQLKRQIDDDAVKAVLLVTYGAGTADQRIVDAIAEKIAEKSIPAFTVSPVNSDPSLGGYVSGNQMPARGIHPLFMTAAAARAKFELGYRQYNGVCDNIVEFMQGDYIGEIPNEVTRRRSPLLRA